MLFELVMENKIVIPSDGRMEVDHMIYKDN